MAYLIARDFLPTTFVLRADWLGNFVGVLASGSNAADLGVTPAQLTDLQAGNAWYRYVLEVYMPYARSYNEGLTAFLNEIDTDKQPQALVLPVWSPTAPDVALPASESGVINRVLEVIDASILKSSHLTPALKTQLRLDPLPTPPAGDPVIKKYVASPGGAIKMTVSVGDSRQIIVESMRGEESEFHYLDKFVGSHFVDNRPNLVEGRPEARQYRIRYSDGTVAYGNYSAVFSVTTQA